MIVLWLAAGLLASAGDAPAVVSGGRITYEEARQQYDSRAKHSIADLADALEPERSVKSQKKKTIPVQALQTEPAALYLPKAAPFGFDNTQTDAIRSAEQLAAMIEMTPEPEDSAAIAVLMMMLEAT